MRYLSTRGGDSEVDFDDVLTRALASDGGLFLPDAWPTPRDWSAFRGQPFEAIAGEVLAIFAEPCLSREEAHSIARRSFTAFRSTDRVPLARYGDDEVLELFHGPTLAFKDVAMQIIARLFERDLARRDAEMTVVVATSGDTGGAAVAALAGRERLRLCVLHPHERISAVQRRFMTTSGAGNVVNLAVEGTFDDCQAIVKALFADHRFADEVSLGGVNSINWARITAQVSYYITACLARGGPGPIHFSVPTGNFGDVFAGFVARKLGAPVGKLIVAVNENDILDRALRTGAYEKRGVRPTASPSMDIEVASNFERALFEAMNRDADQVSGLMEDLKSEGRFVIPGDVLGSLRESYASYRVSEAEVSAKIEEVHRGQDILVDPHTAVGLVAAARARVQGLEGPVITLATAHPAKFPDAVEEATGTRPSVPAETGKTLASGEVFRTVEADEEAVKAILRQ